MLVSTDQHATPTRQYLHPTTTYRYHQALSTSTSTDCKLRQTGLSACTQMATRTLCWLWHAWPLPKCPSRAHHRHCQSALPGPKRMSSQASNQTRVRGRCVRMRTGEHQHMPTPTTTADSGWKWCVCTPRCEQGLFQQPLGTPSAPNTCMQ